MNIGDKVVHKLTSEVFLITGTVNSRNSYSTDTYICIDSNYERHEFLECEITPYVEPETESKDEN